MGYHTYKLYRETKKKAINITAALIIATSGLGSALPLLFNQTTHALAPTVGYSTMPATHPGSFSSLGYEATQTSEFGDYVQLGAGSKKVSSVDVSLTSWACQNDFSQIGGVWVPNRASGNDCATTPDSSYQHDVTLNLYNVDNSSSTPVVGSLIKSVTQSVAVPYRPSYDPTNCPASDPTADAPFGGKWYDTSTSTCTNGYAFNVSVDLTTANITLPSDVIATIAYDTSDYGPAPTHQVGPYDSLNLSLTSATPSVGTNVDPDAVFWNTATAANYTDGGAGGTGTLRQDTGWAGDTPVLQINTVAPPTVAACTTTTTLQVTDLSAWNLSQTRTNGHNVLVANGLHVYTDGNSDTGLRTDGGIGLWNTDKAAGYYTTNFPLSGLGNQTIANSIDYTATTGITPGLQLNVDFDNNGTVDGTLVGESVYGNNWWLSNASSASSQFVKDGAPNNGGGNGSQWYGTPDEWLASFPSASVKAIGYSLGSGVHGDGIIKRISLGCTDYTFSLPAPQSPTSGSTTTTPTSTPPSTTPPSSSAPKNFGVALAPFGEATGITGTLGDSTIAPSAPSTRGSVKGDSTASHKNTPASKKSSKFLGLGWWWLLVLAAVLAGLWFLIAKRRNDDEN